MEKKVAEAQKTIKDWVAETRRKILAFRTEGIPHKDIIAALGIGRTLYWYHLHQIEKHTGKRLK